MAILPAVIGAGASIIGGLISSRGQSNANSTNLQQTRETNRTNQYIQDSVNLYNARNVDSTNLFNQANQRETNETNIRLQDMANQTNISLAEAARRQNDEQLERQFAFQQYNSDTAVRRAMADYKVAGLNPMLAGMNPASAPSGGTIAAPVARVEAARTEATRNEAPRNEAYRASPGRVSNEAEGLGQGIAASFASAAQVKQLDMMQAQIENVNQSTAKTRAETQQVEAELPFSAFNARLKSFKLESELQALKTNIESVTKDIAIKDIDINKLKPLVAEFQELTNKATKAGIPAKEAEAKLFEKLPEAKWLEIARRVLLGR